MKNLVEYLVNESNKLNELYSKVDSFLFDYQDSEFPMIEFFKHASEEKKEELSNILDEIRKIEENK